MYIKSGIKDILSLVLALSVIAVFLCVFAVTEKNKKIWPNVGKMFVLVILCLCYWNVCIINLPELNDVNKENAIKNWVTENLKYPYIMTNFIIKQSDNDNYSICIFGKANIMAFKLRWL